MFWPSDVRSATAKPNNDPIQLSLPPPVDPIGEVSTRPSSSIMIRGPGFCSEASLEIGAKEYTFRDSHGNSYQNCGV